MNRGWMNSLGARRATTHCAWLLMLGTLAGPAAGAKLEFDAAAQSRIGVKTVALATVKSTESIAAVASVIDPTPLIRLNADLLSSAAVAAASGAEEQRARKLQQSDGSVSIKAVEVAHAQALADAAKLSAARAELRANWGNAVAAMNPAVRARWIESLAAGGEVLLRVELLAAAAAPPGTRAWLTLLDHSQRRVELQGILPQSGGASAVIAPALLGHASGGGLVPGMSVAARVETMQPVSGVLLPRAALIRWDGLQWVYVALDGTHFERRAVLEVRPTGDGWLVGHGFKAGEQVVVQGAAALLGAETLAPAEADGADKAPGKEAD